MLGHMRTGSCTSPEEIAFVGSNKGSFVEVAADKQYLNGVGN